MPARNRSRPHPAGEPDTPVPALPERLLRWLFAGIAFVLACAAALSAPTLYNLARLIDFPPQLAWLLPAALDGYAATSIWFGRRIDTAHPAYRSARRNSRLALGMTVACNGLYHFLILAGPLVPAWVRIVLLVTVASLPPLIVDRLLHLNSLAAGTGHAAPATESGSSKKGNGERQTWVASPPGSDPGNADKAPAARVPADAAPAALEVGTGAPAAPAAADPDSGTGKVVALNGGDRRPPAAWAELALPLYRRHCAEHSVPPTANVLVQMLRDAHPDLRVPASERSARNIRAATETLADQDRTEVEAEPDREWASA